MKKLEILEEIVGWTAAIIGVIALAAITFFLVFAAVTVINGTW